MAQTFTLAQTTYKTIRQKLRQPEVLVFCLCITVAAISLARHEPWLDESEAPTRIHSFGLNLWQLTQSFRGDGHFPLYHILLFPLLQIGWALHLDTFTLVKTYTFIQYCCLAFLTCRWVKFPYSLLFLLSYYPLFEYGTISRCYLLGIICLMIMLRSLIFPQPVHKLLLVLAHFCFPLTHVLAFFTSLPLFAYCLLKRRWLQIGAFTTSYVLVLYYLDLGNRKTSASRVVSAAYGLDNIQQTLSTIVHSLFAAWLPFSFEQPWWNHSIVTDSNSILAGFTLLLLSVLLALTFLRLSAFNGLLTLACSIGGICGVAIVIVVFTGFFPTTSFRYLGYSCWPVLCYLVLVMTAQSQTAQSQTAQSPKDAATPAWLNRRVAGLSLQRLTVHASLVLLVLNTVCGVAAVARDFSQPFSATPAIVKRLDRISAEYPKAHFFANPCWAAWPIVAASNWKYTLISPLWNPSVLGCAAAPGGQDPVTSVENLTYPRHSIFITWGLELEDKAFQSPEYDARYNKTFGDFLKEKFTSCEVKHYRSAQIGNQAIYDCRRRRKQ